MGAAITEQNDGYIWQKPTGAPSTLASRITDSPRSRRALMNQRGGGVRRLLIELAIRIEQGRDAGGVGDSGVADVELAHGCSGDPVMEAMKTPARCRIPAQAGKTRTIGRARVRSKSP